MMSYSEIMYLLVAHFIADYVFQSTYTGMNKSKIFTVMVKHIFIYTSVLAVLCLPLFLFVPYGTFFTFIVCNAVMHMITDAITSRLSTKYYEQGRIYAFWKVIGIDQLAHYAVLFYTYVYFLKYE